MMNKVKNIYLSFKDSIHKLFLWLSHSKAVEEVMANTFFFVKVCGYFLLFFLGLRYGLITITTLLLDAAVESISLWFDMCYSVIVNSISGDIESEKAKLEALLEPKKIPHLITFGVFSLILPLFIRPVARYIKRSVFKFLGS